MKCSSPSCERSPDPKVGLRRTPRNGHAEGEFGVRRFRAAPGARVGLGCAARASMRRTPNFPSAASVAVRATLVAVFEGPGLECALPKRGDGVPIGTAVHDRTFRLCESLNYREWSGYYCVSVYEMH